MDHGLWRHITRASARGVPRGPRGRRGGGGARPALPVGSGRTWSDSAERLRALAPVRPAPPGHVCRTPHGSLPSRPARPAPAAAAHGPPSVRAAGSRGGQAAGTGKAPRARAHGGRPPPRGRAACRSPGALSAPAPGEAGGAGGRACGPPRHTGLQEQGGRMVPTARRLRGPAAHGSPPEAAPKGPGLVRPAAGSVWPSVGAVAPSLCGHRRTSLPPLRPRRHGKRLPSPGSEPTLSSRNSTLPQGVRAYVLRARAVLNAAARLLVPRTPPAAQSALRRRTLWACACGPRAPPPRTRRGALTCPRPAGLPPPVGPGGVGRRGGGGRPTAAAAPWACPFPGQ